MWTEESIHIERIFPDEGFWLKNVTKVKHFFDTAILPELVGKIYSRSSDLVNASSSHPAIPSSSCKPALSSTNDSEKKYCYCQGPEEGEMVKCDNPGCVREWFHLSCLKLTSLPKSKHWYCPDCRKLTEFRRKRSKKN